MCCLLSVDDESPDPKLKANVISSTEILSAMSTVNRVVLSAVAVLPDGSCIAQAGSAFRTYCEIGFAKEKYGS